MGQRGQHFAGAGRGRLQVEGGAAVNKSRVSADGFVKSGAPLGEAALLRRDVVAVVGDVVHQTHERIEGGNAVTLRFRQKEKRIVEVAVGFPRQVPAPA
jgi:hypothetical protein